MLKKFEKINTFLLFCSLFVLISCGNLKNCKVAPDYERIGESAIENSENLKETNVRSAIAHCNF